MFATTTKAEASSTMPMTTGRSWLRIASMDVLPSPSRLNTCSVMTAPPRRVPRSMPNWVTIGVSALRSACW